MHIPKPRPKYLQKLQTVGDGVSAHICHLIALKLKEMSRLQPAKSCADPGIFVRGGGGPGQSGKKKSSDNVFFSSPQLILQKSYGQFHRNLSFFMVSEGVQHFPGGPTFSRGSNCLFPIETHITCDFPGGGVRTPYPPSGSALENDKLI